MDEAVCYVSDYPEPNTSKCQLYGTVVSIREVPLSELGIPYGPGAGDKVVEVVLISPGDKVTVQEGTKSIQEVIVKGWRARIYFAPDKFYRPDWKYVFHDQFTKGIIGRGMRWFLTNVRPGSRIHVELIGLDGSSRAKTDYGRKRARMTYKARKQAIEQLREGKKSITAWAGNTWLIER